VLGEVTDSRRCGGWTAGIAELLAVGHVLVQMMLDVEPRTLILGLVLNPDDFLGVAVFLELGLKGLVRKRVQLFDTQDGYILAPGFVARMNDIVINLA